MKSIIVKDKIIPIAGATTLIVQGEVEPEEIRFVFNTEQEHTFLANVNTWKLWYKRRDKQGTSVILSKTNNSDGTWYVSWNPDNHATYLNGQFVFLITAYSDGNDVSPIWKTVACPITIAKCVDPEIIDPSEKTLSYDTILLEFENWINEKLGQPNGIATLNENGKVPEEQIDNSQILEEINKYKVKYVKTYSDLPAIGREGVLYIVTDSPYSYVFNNGSIESEPIGYYKINGWDVIQCQL